MIQSTQELLDVITEILSKANVNPEVTKIVTDVVSEKINAVVSDQLNAALDAAVAPAVTKEVGNIKQLNTDLQLAIDSFKTRISLIAERLKANDVDGAAAAANLEA